MFKADFPSSPVVEGSEKGFTPVSSGGEVLSCLGEKVNSFKAIVGCHLDNVEECLDRERLQQLRSQEQVRYPDIKTNQRGRGRSPYFLEGMSAVDNVLAFLAVPSLFRPFLQVGYFSKPSKIFPET